MTETGHPEAAGVGRPPARGSAPLATYAVRWYRYLVGGTFLVLALLFLAGALPVLTSQPGAAAFLLGFALLMGAAGVNGLTLGKLMVYSDGLLFSRGVLLGSRWIPRARIDHISLGRGSSTISAPFLIPIVHCTGGKRYKFQSLRGLRRTGRECVPERIVQDLQRWCAGPALS
jgi:hypothetical protein